MADAPVVLEYQAHQRRRTARMLAWATGAAGLVGGYWYIVAAGNDEPTTTPLVITAAGLGASLGFRVAQKGPPVSKPH